MTGSEITAERPMRHISSWKVFGVFCLVVFLFLFGVVFIPWDVQAPNDADLQFKPLTLEAGKNAFTYLEAAGSMCVTKFPKAGEPDRDWTNLSDLIGSKSEEWDPAFADEVLAANESAFKELEAGLACERYASPQFKDVTIIHLSGLQKYKQLTQLLCLKSKRAQVSGDYAAAASSATQAFRLGQLVTDDANLLIEWLVGIAYESIALARMNEIIADVKTSEPVLRDLLAQLDRWNPKGIERGYRQAMQEEYRFGKVTHEMLRHGNAAKIFDPNDPFRYWCRVPYCFKLNMTTRMMVPFYRNLIENADRVYAKTNFDYPGMLKYPSGTPDRVALYMSPNSAGKVMLLQLTPALEKALTKKYLIQANVAGLRLKIALRLYEQKHGQLPDDLKALVSEFIKEVPIDSYDGQPFRYSKAERRVWAIGSDLVDNGGNMRDDTEMVDAVPSRKCDVGLRLETREMKPTPPPPPGSKPKEDETPF
jgi:hypothetical protein